MYLCFTNHLLGTRKEKLVLFFIIAVFRNTKPEFVMLVQQKLHLPTVVHVQMQFVHYLKP